jgi:heptosyltransferase-1
MDLVPLIPEPRRILIIKPSAIGDIVHTLPVLNLLRKRYRNAKLSWLVTPACAALVENHPQVDEVIQFNRKRYGHAWRSPTASAAFFAFIRSLRDRQFDWSLDFQGLFRSGWMSWASGARVRVGFDDAREGATMFYTHPVPSGGWWHQHATGRYLHFASALGCQTQPLEYHFAVSEADRQAVAKMLPEKYAVLIPGANWLSKRWPAENFAELATRMMQRFGLEAVTIGGPDDREAGERIGAAYNLIGRTTLPQTIAVLEKAALVIGNDSGPMHIAAALDRPLVALYGPTNAILTGPYRRLDSVVRVDIPCSPCYSRSCSHQSCLRFLEVEPVMREAERQLERANLNLSHAYFHGN